MSAFVSEGGREGGKGGGGRTFCMGSFSPLPRSSPWRWGVEITRSTTCDIPVLPVHSRPYYLFSLGCRVVFSDCPAVADRQTLCYLRNASSNSYRFPIVARCHPTVISCNRRR